MNQEVFAAVADALERGEPAALVTIVSATGSTPQRVGAKMLVFGDGRIVGTIGGGCYENDAFWKAREAITNRKPQLVHYELDDDFAQETGLICGGQMDVYIEPIEPSPELYIVGAGHVGFHLARVAHEVGFRVHVVDDREKFANRERFPDAVEIVVEDIPAWIARTSASAARVHRDRDARPHERPRSAARAGAARAALSRPDRQPGEGRAHLRTARRRQMPPELLKRVHAPIGLDIGAVTPQEIAVSILAELIAVKHGKMAGRDAGELSMKWDPRSRATEARGRGETICLTLRLRDLCASYVSSLLIRNGLIVTMNDACDIVAGDVSIRDGRIAAVGPDVDRIAARRVIDARGGYVLPGFIQTHMHLCQTLFRGYADDLPLMDWLRRASGRWKRRTRPPRCSAARLGDHRAAARAARPPC